MSYTFPHLPLKSCGSRQTQTKGSYPATGNPRVWQLASLHLKWHASVCRAEWGPSIFPLGRILFPPHARRTPEPGDMLFGRFLVLAGWGGGQVIGHAEHLSWSGLLGSLVFIGFFFWGFAELVLISYNHIQSWFLPFPVIVELVPKSLEPKCLKTWNS